MYQFNIPNYSKLSEYLRSYIIIELWMNAICLFEELELRLKGQGLDVETTYKNA